MITVRLGSSYILNEIVFSYREVNKSNHHNNVMTNLPNLTRFPLAHTLSLVLPCLLFSTTYSRDETQYGSMLYYVLCLIVLQYCMYYLKHAASLYEIYSSRWESSGKYSTSLYLLLYLLWDSRKVLYTFMQMNWQCFKCFIVFYP